MMMMMAMMMMIGGCGYRTSPAAFVHNARPTVSRSSRVVPLAHVALLAHEPSSGVGPVFAHRERESQPPTHSAHDVAGVIVWVTWHHQFQRRGGACGVVSGTDGRSSLAPGGTETPPTDGAYRRGVRNPFLFRTIHVRYPWLIKFPWLVPRLMTTLRSVERCEPRAIKMALFSHGTSPKVGWIENSTWHMILLSQRERTSRKSA